MHWPTSACLVSLQSPSSVRQDDWASFFNLRWRLDPLASFRRQYFAILMLFAHCKRQSRHSIKVRRLNRLSWHVLLVYFYGWACYFLLDSLHYSFDYVSLSLLNCLFVWWINLQIRCTGAWDDAIIYQPTMMLHWRWCILNSGECKMAVHHVSNK